MKKIEVKYFTSPDEVRSFEHGMLELITVGGSMIGKATFEPGWKWSTSVKPLVKTNLCEAPHLQYLISGTLHVVMADGTETDLLPGSVSSIPSGHDAWVVGQEPVVAVDFLGMVDYAKKV
jgi:hypothetical protein